jgi:mannose-6-phosphate isomerase-like protein (cupin superfamily)
MSVVSVAAELAQISEHWSPRIIAELNGQQVKLARIQGEFLWHLHESESELFFVLAGELTMEFRDRRETVRPGEMIVVPAGVEHRPVAAVETHILLFEPASTLNTGNVRNERTRDVLDRREGIA